MFFERSTVRAALEHIIRKLTSDPELQKDLRQEGLLDLWVEETLDAGKTESWYLQHCSFHLNDELGKGHSLDSYKHRKDQAAPPHQFAFTEAAMLAWAAVGAPAQGEPASRRQILVAAHLLQETRSERAQPCDRYSPGWVSAPPVGGRHVLPGAARCIVRAPDSLQIVPGLHLT